MEAKRVQPYKINHDVETLVSQLSVTHYEKEIVGTIPLMSEIQTNVSVVVASHTPIFILIRAKGSYNSSFLPGLFLGIDS
ncbi:hypothetical protein J6590_018393 [Homalodisca vitripennis]|nr:hypothetical protein J6590_018393 [Homalodisca vitripennis]